MEMEFYKYQGTGNDFIIVDGIQHSAQLSIAQIQKCCDRRFGIGADGLIIIKSHPDYDFEMEYYNADGHVGSMCGNGGRCIVHFALSKGYVKKQCRFLAVDGIHEAILLRNGNISLQMKDVKGIQTVDNDFFLNTGSPHHIRFVKDIENFNVFKEGNTIRNNERYKKEGTNVNFAEWIGDRLFVRTYERGVEEETLSCGTGVTAAAIVAGNTRNNEKSNTINIKTRGGDLAVSYTVNDTGFSDIRLEGPATFVYKGIIEL